MSFPARTLLLLAAFACNAPVDDDSPDDVNNDTDVETSCDAQAVTVGGSVTLEPGCLALLTLPNSAGVHILPTTGSASIELGDDTQVFATFDSAAGFIANFNAGSFNLTNLEGDAVTLELVDGCDIDVEITSGQSYGGTVGDGDCVLDDDRYDSYVFTVPERSVVSAAFVGFQGTQGSLELLDASETVVAQVDIGGFGLGGLEDTAVPAGSYTMRVRATGAYDLSPTIEPACVVEPLEIADVVRGELIDGACPVTSADYGRLWDIELAQETVLHVFTDVDAVVDLANPDGSLVDGRDTGPGFASATLDAGTYSPAMYDHVGRFQLVALRDPMPQCRPAGVLQANDPRLDFTAFCSHPTELYVVLTKALVWAEEGDTITVGAADDPDVRLINANGTPRFGCSAAGTRECSIDVTEAGPYLIETSLPLGNPGDGYDAWVRVD